MTIYQKTATLSYRPVTGAPTVNPVTGRVTIEQGELVELDVSIEQRDTMGQAISMNGKDIIVTRAEGRLLPIGTPLPNSYTPGLECDVLMVDGYKCKAYIQMKVPSRFGLENVFGQRITLNLFEPN